MQRRLPPSIVTGKFNSLIRTQAPCIYGCRDLKDKRDNKRYLEAYLDIEEDTSVITNGLAFDTPQGRITTTPCKALDDDSDIVRLSLSKLPFEPERYLVPKLVASLTSYGVVHDLSLFKDSPSGMFMGTGTAIICKRRNTPGEDGTTTFQPLTHKIPYLDTLDSFHAVWANIRTWCRYCHEEGHTKYDCAGSLASMTCHYCKEQGHRAANCPKKTPLVSQIQEEPISVSQASNSTNPFQTLEDQSAFDDSLDTNSTTTTTTPTKYSTGDKRPAMIDESNAESTPRGRYQP